MNEQITWDRRLIGPALTVLATFTYDWLVTYNLVPTSTAFLFPFIVWAAYEGGLRSGLVAAAWLGGYAYYLFYDDSPARAAIILICAMATAYMVGVLKRRSRSAAENAVKAQAFDALNGNILKLKNIESNMFDLIQGWRAITEESRLSTVRSIYQDTVSLATVVAGWRELYRERMELLAEHAARQAAKQRTDDPPGEEKQTGWRYILLRIKRVTRNKKENSP